MANLISIHERNLSLKIWCHCLLQEYYGENVLHMSAVAEDPSVVKVGIAVHLFPPCHALFCSQLSFRSSSAVSFVLANCLLFFFHLYPISLSPVAYSNGNITFHICMSHQHLFTYIQCPRYQTCYLFFYLVTCFSSYSFTCF